MSQGQLFDLNKNLGGKAYIEPGIHTEAQCLNMETAENYTDIFIELDGGGQVKDRIYFPDPEKVYLRDGETQEQAVKREVDNTADRLSQYAQIFLNENERTQVAMKANDLKGLALALESVLPTRFPSKKVDIKLVPGKDKEGNYKYSNFPRYPLYIKESGDDTKTLKFSKYERGLLQAWATQTLEDKDDDTSAEEGPLY
jgi:hypothetical protein